ncbi:MAG: alanine/ornithine racemase family PLP-dependent enzyme [Candidatus Mcinerneyibacterium aminivorans]|jgi:predicted amino acid racemase|uniref:Alanine/ornithine racemase family PLP-dependent enzyme n=1 Tax=Candidatus Mcinerneyibacterium aminivorans TaxID=2703815 RepID=A0A5D0MIK0_9BACT|nr:MAG: alanine/ornithine racemase family PLP-dependent enzyme [Candidatus Mcinerneyibacterium aminivorans]
MAYLTVYTKRILKNIKKIDRIMQEHNKKWTLVAKVLGGHEESLKNVLSLCSDVKNLTGVADSRLTSLETIKNINSNVKTMYIAPPSRKSVNKVVKYADISLNSSFSTIKKLNKAAKEENTVQKIIIMVELGELREGVLRENIVEFYEKVFKLDNIKVIGLGTNLGCMYGVEPTYDKLIQLSLYKEIIEAKFDKKLEIISGGSSISLPMLFKDKIPENMNHFRIGEAAFLGTTPLTEGKFRNLSRNTFKFYSYIIELEEKRSKPQGNLTDANVGDGLPYEPEENETILRAVLDYGKLDVDNKHLKPKNPDMTFAGSSSDMSVYNVKQITKKDGNKMYKVGSKIQFNLDYMGVARLMTSKYIKKRVV